MQGSGRRTNYIAFLEPSANFTYIRWLGDRKGIEEKTKTWDKVVVDRCRDLSEWAKLCVPIVRRGVTIYAYANNHYAGHAPATVADFLKVWNRARGKA